MTTRGERSISALICRSCACSACSCATMRSVCSPMWASSSRPRSCERTVRSPLPMDASVAASCRARLNHNRCNSKARAATASSTASASRASSDCTTLRRTATGRVRSCQTSRRCPSCSGTTARSDGRATSVSTSIARGRPRASQARSSGGCKGSPSTSASGRPRSRRDNEASSVPAPSTRYARSTPSCSASAPTSRRISKVSPMPIRVSSRDWSMFRRSRKRAVSSAATSLSMRPICCW